MYHAVSRDDLAAEPETAADKCSRNSRAIAIYSSTSSTMARTVDYHQKCEVYIDTTMAIKRRGFTEAPVCTPYIIFHVMNDDYMKNYWLNF